MHLDTLLLVKDELHDVTLNFFTAIVNLLNYIFAQEYDLFTTESSLYLYMLLNTSITFVNYIEFFGSSVSVYWQAVKYLFFFFNSVWIYVYNWNQFSTTQAFVNSFVTVTYILDEILLYFSKSIAVDTKMVGNTERGITFYLYLIYSIF